MESSGPWPTLGGQPPVRRARTRQRHLPDDSHRWPL